MAANLLCAQNDVLSAEVTNASIENNCEDGFIDLTITGGFPPYDVIWDYNNCPTNPVLPSVTILDFHTASGVQGTNDGEDIDAPAPSGCYTVTVTDALCGTAEADFEILCECPECELIGEVENVRCNQMNGSITVTLNCDVEENASQTYT